MRTDGYLILYPILVIGIWLSYAFIPEDNTEILKVPISLSNMED